MNSNQIKAIGKRLAPHLSEFICMGRLIVLVPVSSVVRGFCFDPSGFSKNAFYVWEFFQPLFVPAREVTLLFGRRLEDGRRWRSDDRNLDSELLSRMKARVPELLELDNTVAIASAVEAFTKPNAVGYVNPHCLEAFAYALIQADQIERAHQVLGSLMEKIDTKIAWQQEIGLRAAGIREMLLERPQKVVEHCAAWEAEPARNLGLQDFLIRSCMVM